MLVRGFERVYAVGDLVLRAARALRVDPLSAMGRRDRHRRARRRRDRRRRRRLRAAAVLVDRHRGAARRRGRCRRRSSSEWRVEGGLHVGRDAAGDGGLRDGGRRSDDGCARRGSSSLPRVHDPPVASVSEPTAPENGPLRLDASREELLDRAAAIVTDAWRSFDRFRPGQPPVDDLCAALVELRLPEAPDTGLRGPRRRGHRARPQPGAAPAAVLRLRRLVGARDRRPRRSARILLRRQPRGVGGGGDRGRGAGRALGRRARRVRRRGRGVHERRHRVERHGARRRARARRARLAPRRPRGQAGGRVLLERGALLGDSQRGAARYRRRQRSRAADRRRPAARSRGRRRRDRPRPRGRRRPDRRRSPRPAPRSPAPSIRSMRSPTSARERGVWLHVDGAYGLPAAAVPETSALFAGLDRADSATIDAHKWLYLPKACGVVLVRRRADLAAALAHEEDYFPHERNEPHAVDITLEYSRPFRALKLWLAFRAHGAARLPSGDRAQPRTGEASARGGRGAARARVAVRAATAVDRPLPAPRCRR